MGRESETLVLVMIMAWVFGRFLAGSRRRTGERVLRHALLSRNPRSKGGSRYAFTVSAMISPRWTMSGPISTQSVYDCTFPS